MKFSEFIEENKITWYKLAQIGGFNPAQYSGSTKKKAIGSRPIAYEELKRYCLGLSKYLNKDIKPEMFEYTIKEILM